MLVSGIARPHSFRQLVEAQGAVVESEMIFGDHYPYRKADIRRIAAAFQACGAQHILTTAKDAVKLSTLIDADKALSFLVLEVIFEIEEDFLPALIEAIRRKSVAGA
jgi:tetraacyldisaccharide 4'-kinase